MIRSRTQNIAANIIKFGVPLGVILVIEQLVYNYFLSADGITQENILFCIWLLFLGIMFGAVLGLIRSNRQ